MATLIFDFDDTLYDTAKLKQDIFSTLSSCGFSSEIIAETYGQTTSSGNYSFERHVQALKNAKAEFDEMKVLKALHNLLSPSYAFPGLDKVLTSLTDKYKLILLTKGEPNYQQEKINNSDLKKFFKNEDIYITEGNKIDILKNMKLEEPVYFINDKQKENDEVRKEFKNLQCILISLENPIVNINFEK